MLMMAYNPGEERFTLNIDEHFDLNRQQNANLRRKRNLKLYHRHGRLYPEPNDAEL